MNGYRRITNLRPGLQRYKVFPDGRILDAHDNEVDTAQNGELIELWTTQGNKPIWITRAEVVATEFLTKPHPKAELIRRDSNPHNDHVSNLYWYVDPDVLKDENIRKERKARREEIKRHKITVKQLLDKGLSYLEIQQMKGYEADVIFEAGAEWRNSRAK